jgi:IclR helix-turn-helix domain
MNGKATRPESGNGKVTLAAVKTAVEEWLLLPDGGLVVEVILAAVVANRMEGDPFWLFLVNPPGGVKTELIRALNGAPDIHPLSNLTPQTFASGYESRKAEPSLLLRLHRHILTLKDFTTVLTLHRDKRGEILAQLREIYDGHYCKEFGNGKVVDWSGKVGLIAGVTQIIDTQYAVNQVLGERFICFRIRSQDAVRVAERAIHNQGREEGMRSTLREMVGGFLQGLEITPVARPDSLVRKISHLAVFCAMARSAVIRDHKGEIEYIPEHEGPGRLAKQLVLFGEALAIVRGKKVLGEEEYRVLYRLVEDTIPRHKFQLLALLIAAGGAVTTQDAAEQSGYPRETTRRYLQDLTAMQLVTRCPGGGVNADRWQLSAYCINVLEKANPDQGGLPLYHTPDTSEELTPPSSPAASGGR